MIRLTRKTPMLTIQLQTIQAMEFAAPEVPRFAADVMPEQTDNFMSALGELAEKTIGKLIPELSEAMETCMAVILCVLLISSLNAFSGKIQRTTKLIGAFQISSILLMNTRSMIGLAADTIDRLSEYGKLLFPVMTAAVAAQGGVTTSAALYAGTAAFDTILCNMISNVQVPMVYMFLVLHIAHAATGETYLKKLLDAVKGLISWSLRIILIVFTTYMSITGVVSGTTDAAVLKATKVTISTVVPIVGGILSDASEAVLVGAGLMKNTAGIYGMIAILAMFLEPFLKIGIHYIALKLAAAISAIFGSKECAELIEHFGGAMGMLLAMTGAVCLLLMISVVCFLKGIG